MAEVGKAFLILGLVLAVFNLSPNVHAYNFNIRGGCDFLQKLDTSSTQSPPSSGNLGSVTWHQALGAGNSGQRKGVLKVTPTSQAQGVKIYLGLVNPTGFTFNIGDSRVNNGHGGGWGPYDDDWCAEIHNKDQSLLIYENARVLRGPRVALHRIAQYFTSPSSRFDVDIARNNIVNIGVNPVIPQASIQFRDDQLFKFDDGLYVGLNRVIAGSYRSGTGLYGVCVKFY